jgi:phosphatidylglycerophosphate synthase
LLDFVDGEVARLLNRASKRGFFIDLICHGLIKSSLFLAVGYGVYRYNHRARALLLAFVACAAVSSIYSLPFLAQAAKVIDERASDGVPRSTRSTTSSLRNLLATFPESPGLYGLVLLGAIFDRLSWVVALYAILGPIWFLRKVIRFR